MSSFPFLPSSDDHRACEIGSGLVALRRRCGLRQGPAPGGWPARPLHLSHCFRFVTYALISSSCTLRVLVFQAGTLPVACIDASIQSKHEKTRIQIPSHLIHLVTVPVFWAAASLSVPPCPFCSAFVLV
jgi:hypothetical protein